MVIVRVLAIGDRPSDKAVGRFDRDQIDRSGFQNIGDHGVRRLVIRDPGAGLGRVAVRAVRRLEELAQTGADQVVFGHAVPPVVDRVDRRLVDDRFDVGAGVLDHDPGKLREIGVPEVESLAREVVPHDLFGVVERRGF